MTPNTEVAAALELYSNLQGGEIGVVLDNHYRPLLKTTSGEELTEKLNSAAPALFVAASVLMSRLTLYPDICDSLDSDPVLVAAAALMTETMLKMQGREFNPEEYE